MKKISNCKTIIKKICESENPSEIQNNDSQVRKHISECKSCSAYLQSLQSTISLYHDYSATLSKELKQEIMAKVCQKLKK